MALIKDGVIYRNLQEQVEKNKCDIEELEGTKQEKLIAGRNITIEGNVISAEGGGGGDAVWGSITGNIEKQADLVGVLAGMEEEVSEAISNERSTRSSADEILQHNINVVSAEVEKKSPKLIAGANITLTEVKDQLEISASGELASTEWGQITGAIDDQKDLYTYLENFDNDIINLNAAVNNRATKVEFDEEVMRAQAAEEAIRNSVQEADGRITQVATDLSVETARANNVEQALNTRLTIAEETINRKQDTLSAGSGIIISNNTVIADTDVVATKESVDNERSGRIATDNMLLSALGGLKFQAVTTLPADPDQDTIYFVVGA